MTNTKFYLHSMGRKNGSVNNEVKQYVTREATVLFIRPKQDLTAHTSVHSSTTSKATVADKHGAFSSALHGDVTTV